jgi:hypothetical protein
MKNTLVITVTTIGLLLNGCKKEEKAATAAPKTSAIEVTPKSFGHEAEKDLLEMKRLAQIAKNKVTAAKTQTIFTQWAGAITRYKQVYGFYPNIGATYDSSKDSVHLLDNPATNLKFVKALSGKLPTGIPLSVADMKTLNKNGEEFCEFRQSDFDDLANLAERSMLVDGFGNSKIRIIVDTDNNSVIRNIKVSDLPEEISAAATEGGIKARVIIYSKGENGAPDVVAIQ